MHFVFPPWVVSGGTLCRAMINKPPPHNRDYNRDPHIKGLKRRGFIHHGSTLCGGPVELASEVHRAP